MKLFDSESAEGFKADVSLLLSLSDNQLNQVSNWIVKTSNVYPLSSTDLDAISDGVHPSDMVRILALLRYVIGTCRSRSLTLDDIKSDLGELSFSAAQVKRATKFFASLEVAKEKVHKAILRNVYEKIGLPTVDDVNITWDMRPVFEELIYPGEPQTDRYQNLVDRIFVLLIEFSASRADGKQESQTYQFSEDEFERFFMSLQRAKRQLEIFRQVATR